MVSTSPAKLMPWHWPKMRRHHARDDVVTEYLHLDGQWRISTLNQDTGQYTGYYNTREQAQRIMECY